MLVVLLCILRLLYSRARSARVHLIKDAEGGETLIVPARVSGLGKTLFMVDTAYAGAPVLSLSYLRRHDPRTGGSVRERYRRALGRLKEPPTEEEMRESLGHFLRRGSCRAFTSGCTMRLMGIGETTETQADLFVCPSVKLEGLATVFDSDILVTNPLPGCVHILTMDYLMHRSPVLLSMRQCRIYFRSMPNPLMQMVPYTSVGGAFCISVTVSGTPLRCVLDTGAAVTLSISKSSAAKIKTCMSTPQGDASVVQVGVNGERVCSDVVIADVMVGTHSLPSTHIFLNSHEVEGADAYMGMGLMRAFDWWFSSKTVGFCPSGKKPRFQYSLSASGCGNGKARCLAGP